MKRLLSLVFALMLAASSFVAAFAADDFKGVVSNKNGASCYERHTTVLTNKEDYRTTGNKIPYNTEVTITDEFTFGNETYYVVSYGENQTANVRVNDISIGGESGFSADSGYKLSSAKQTAVINTNGINLYEGPSTSYAKVGEKVPYGAVLTYNRINAKNGEWAYTTYEGQSGWFKYYQYGKSFDCASIVDGSDGLTGKLVVSQEGLKLSTTPQKMWDYGNLGSTIKFVTDVIPVGTTFSYKYYYSFDTSKSAYVSYEGTNGWIMLDDDYGSVETGKKGAVTVKGSTTVYKDHSSSSSSIGTLSSGSTVASDYVFVEYYDGDTINWYRVNYNGKTGWVKKSSNVSYSASSTAPKITVVEEPSETEKKEEESKVPESKAELPKDEEKVTETTTFVEEITTEPEFVSDVFEPGEDIVKAPVTTAAAADEGSSPEIGSNKTVIAAFAGALALCLAAGGAIFFIKQKKSR